MDVKNTLGRGKIVERWWRSDPLRCHVVVFELVSVGLEVSEVNEEKHVFAASRTQDLKTRSSRSISRSSHARHSCGVKSAGQNQRREVRDTA